MELITRQLEPRGEIVEAFRIDGGPRVELPLDSPVLVRYEAGGSIGVVTMDIFAGRVRFIDRADVDAAESLESQVGRLADFISSEIPGEPSQSEGAIDTAIRLLRAGLDGSSK